MKPLSYRLKILILNQAVALLILAILCYVVKGFTDKEPKVPSSEPYSNIVHEFKSGELQGCKIYEVKLNGNYLNVTRCPKFDTNSTGSERNKTFTFQESYNA